MVSVSRGGLPARHPGYVPGRYYMTSEGSTTAGTAVPAADTLYAYPFVLRDYATLKKLAIRVATGGAGSAVKMALYANSRVLGLPVGVPLAADNTGKATTSNSTTVEAAFDVPLVPGVYWCAQKYTGTLPSCVSMPTGSANMDAMIGRTSIGSNGALLALSLAATYADDMPSLEGNEAWSEVTVAGVPILRFVP
jgi:phosphoribosylcarboxyaminoimidazole (NCAIR) mutase